MTKGRIQGRFVGSKEQKVDRKGRVSIPERFRRIIELGGDSEVVLTRHIKPDRRCVVVWPTAEFEGMIEALEDDSVSDELREMVNYWVVSSMETVTIDPNGRVVVPQLLRRFAGLDDQARFVGSINVVELWDPERFDQTLASMGGGMSEEIASFQKTYRALRKKRRSDGEPSGVAADEEGARETST